MKASRSGSVSWHGTHWDIRVTLSDGTRSNAHCCAIGTTEREARAEAAQLTRQAHAEGWTRPQKAAVIGDTASSFDAYCEKQWLGTRRDSKDANAHLRFHIYPTILRDGSRFMDRRIQDIKREDIEAVIARLDERVRAGEIAWKTAHNVFGTLSKLFDDATNAKRLELRVLKSDPAEGVRGPDRGDERASA